LEIEAVVTSESAAGVEKRGLVNQRIISLIGFT